MNNKELHNADLVSGLAAIVQNHSPFRLHPKLNSNFTTDLAIDSLSFVSLISEIENEFNVSLSPDEIIEVHQSNLESLAQLINNKLHQKNY